MILSRIQQIQFISIMGQIHLTTRYPAPTRVSYTYTFQDNSSGIFDPAIICFQSLRRSGSVVMKYRGASVTFPIRFIFDSWTSSRKQECRLHNPGRDVWTEQTNLLLPVFLRKGHAIGREIVNSVIRNRVDLSGSTDTTRSFTVTVSSIRNMPESSSSIISMISLVELQHYSHWWQKKTKGYTFLLILSVQNDIFSDLPLVKTVTYFKAVQY